VPEKDRTADGQTVPLSHEIKTSTILSNVYAALLRATDRSAIFQVLRRSLSVFLGIEAMMLFEYEPERRHLIGRYAAGKALPLAVNRLRIPLTASECLPVISHLSGNTANSFSSARRDKLTIIDRQLMTCLNTDGIVCLPVRPAPSGDQTILILGVESSEWPWVERQATLLQSIAAAVAGALTREQRAQDRRDRQATHRDALAASKTRKLVHEINNPLSIIKNYLKVLTLRTDEDSPGKEELRIIDEEINRVTALIGSLASPSETIPKNPDPVDVNATITDILGLFRESLPRTAAIRLDQDLDPHLPVLASGRNRLKQALINLLKNAMEAMPDGGTIKVSTRMQSAPRRNAGGQESAGHIRISICDDGPGIDERIKDDLFKPNVTSKTGHDGLGLAIVHETVAHLRGSLWCESAPGGGTCFHIELPTSGNGSHNGNGTSSVS
jgi:signal transduction histidine kinase